MKPITMDGKYVLDAAHRTPVRILCIDAPGGYPVVAISDRGTMYRRKADGTRDGVWPIVSDEPDRLWKVSWPGGGWTTYEAEYPARDYAARNESSVVTEFVEVTE